jgi:hypothetical protein
MRAKILAILKLSGIGELPETALRMEIELRFRQRVGDMEFAEALGALKAGAYISCSEDALTGDRLWRLGNV